MRRALLVGVSIALGIQTGCTFQVLGGRCAEACTKVWSPDECNIQVPGISQSSMLDECISDCRSAADQGGELEGYDPWEQSIYGDPIELSNRAQVQEWADCVEATTCDDLMIGYCWPL